MWAEWDILCCISDKYHLLRFHRQRVNNLSNTDSKRYDSSYPKSLPDVADGGISLALIGKDWIQLNGSWQKRGSGSDGYPPLISCVVGRF